MMKVDRLRFLLIVLLVLGSLAMLSNRESDDDFEAVGGSPWKSTNSRVEVSSKEILTVVLPPRTLSILVFTSNFFDLLGHLDRPIRYVTWENFDPADKTTWKVMNNSLIIAFQATIFKAEPTAYLKYARSLGVKNIGIFHMADETCVFPTDFYRQADYVIRNYICPKVFKQFPETLWVPNGWADQVGPRDPKSLVPASKRMTDCYFTGRPAPERKEFLDLWRRGDIECRVDETEGFGLGKPRPVYSLDLAEARFAPCPSGNSPETIRFYDALENGAIPVMLDCIFTEHLFPKETRESNPPPFLIISKWSDYGEAVKPYLTNPAALDALQAQAVGWWQQQKEYTRTHAAQLVEWSFSNGRE